MADNTFSGEIVRASWCRYCGASIGQKCTDRHGTPTLPHPFRQKRAAARFPEIAAQLAVIAAEAPATQSRDKLSGGRLEEAGKLQGLLPMHAIAEKYGVSEPTLRTYLQRAGLHKPAPLARGSRGRWLKGVVANPSGFNGPMTGRTSPGNRKLHKLKASHLREISAKLGEISVAQLARDYRVGIATMWRAVNVIKRSDGHANL